MTEIIDRFGQRRRLAPGEHLPDGARWDVARDGDAVRVPMMLMDSDLDPVQRAIRDSAASRDLVRNAFDAVHPGLGGLNRPGPRHLAGRAADAAAAAERVAARDAMVKDLGQAWRAPPPENGSRAKPPERTTDAAAARDAAWGGMVKDLSEAWRRG